MLDGVPSFQEWDTALGMELRRDKTGHLCDFRIRKYGTEHNIYGYAKFQPYFFLKKMESAAFSRESCYKVEARQCYACIYLYISPV